MPLVIIVLRVLGVSAGVIMIGLGIPLFFLPIPLGLIFIAMGLVVLAISSTEVARWIAGLRRRHPKLDRRLRRIEDGLPAILRRLLAGSRPA